MEAEIFEIGRETLTDSWQKNCNRHCRKPGEKSAAVEEDDHRHCDRRTVDSHPVLCLSDLQTACDQWDLRDLEQRLEELDADRERQTLLQQLQSETAIQQGVQTQEE